MNSGWILRNVPEQNNSFLNFLNDYDAMYGNDLEVNENVVDEIPEQNIGINNVEMINQNNNVVENTNNNDTFLNFLNNYQDDSLNETVSSSVDVASNINNPVINEVVPPITSNFNVNPIKYVEDDVRYEDITKPDMLNSIDDIINELKVAVNKIKNSKFKIDTDEINFDDIYQITIKIDKRDIL